MDNLQVYIINLDRATDRWNNWKNIDMGFPKNNIHRFSAIDGRSLSDDEVKMHTTPLTFLKILGGVKRSPEDLDNKGALCASLSHFGVWNDFLKNYPDSKYLLVFEDDTVLDEMQKKDLYNMLKKHHDKLPSGWDVWIFGYTLLRDSSDWNNPDPTPHSSNLLKNPTYIKNGKSQYRDVRNYWGANSYIIKRETLEKISKYNYPIETHIDLYLSLLANIGIIRIIEDKTLILPQESIFGTIPHSYYTIALINQHDLWYKVGVILFLILLLILILFYFGKGCSGFNFFHFLGNKLSCKMPQ